MFICYCIIILRDNRLVYLLLDIFMFLYIIKDGVIRLVGYLIVGGNRINLLLL